MGKITDKKGRQSIEEFSPDHMEGDQTYTPSGDDALRDASFKFPNSGERLSPTPGTSDLRNPFDLEGLSDASGITDLHDDAGLTSIPDFKFLECDPQLPGQEPDPCAVCRPNPYAYVPDYRLMKSGETFFDGKRCFQSITLTVPSPVKPRGPTVEELEDPAYQRQKKEEGIRLMLDYFNKSDVATVYYYVEQPPRGGNFNILGGGIAGLAAGAALGGLGFPGLSPFVGAVIGATAGTIVGGGLDALVPPPIAGYDLQADERDIIKELMKYTEFEYSIPIQKKGQTRILISFSVEYLNRIPTRAVIEPDTGFQTDLECTIMGVDFYPMFRRSLRALKVYSRQHDSWTALDGGGFVEYSPLSSDDSSPDGPAKPEYINFHDEALHLQNFRDVINEFIHQHGLSFRGFKQIEKITFKFTQPKPNKIELRQMVFNKPGCPDIVIGKNGRYKGLFKDLVKQNPLKRSRTLFYVGALPEMDMALQARAPTPWLDFVTTYTFPRIEVKYGTNSNTIINDPNLLGCFGQSTFADSSVDEFFNTITGIGLSLPDAILEGMAKDTCKTREVAQEEAEELGSGKKGRKTVKDVAKNTAKETGRVSKEQYSDFKSELKKQYDRAIAEQKRKLATNDPYLNVVMEEVMAQMAQGRAMGQMDRAFRKVSKVVPDYEYKKGSIRRDYRRIARDNKQLLWGRINNRLGWCGWLALTMRAVDCVAQGLGAESATGALTEAAFNAMSDAHLERIFVGLSPEDQQRVFDTLSEDLQGLPAPWDLDFVIGSYSGPGFSLREAAESRRDKKRRDNAIEAYGELAGFGADVDSDFFQDATTEEIEELALELGQVSVETLEDIVEEELEEYMYAPNYTFASEGDFGDDVVALNQTLYYLGYDLDTDEREFTSDTTAVIEKYQKDNNLPVTGKATEGLLDALRASVDRRTQEIRMALAASQPPPPPTVSTQPGIPGIPGSQDPGIYGVGYSEGSFSFGGAGSDNPGSGGTYGTALKDFNKVLVDAYRNAILKSVGADVLLNELNRLPGAPIVASFIKHLPCKPSPPWAMDPRLDNFMSTLQFGINMETCKWDNDISMPAWDVPDEGSNNIFIWIYENILEAVKNAIVAAAMAALKLILEKIGQIACEALATLGASLLDLYDGSDHFRDLLRDNMCPDASEDDLYDALTGILETVGDTDADCLETLTNSEMADFIDDLSLMLTQGQIIELLSGEISEETLKLCLEVAATSDSECIREIFSDPNAFTTYFPSLGTFIPLDEIRASLEPNDIDLPVFPCPPEITERIDDLKCGLLEQKGLSPEECRDQLDDIKDKALQDLIDLADLMNNGPFSDFPPLIDDPGAICPGNGFYNSHDPFVQDLAVSVSSLLFSPIEERHLRDLMGPVNTFTGHGGVINALLSDTKGRPWKKHNFMVRFFGSPNAADLGWLEGQSDNAILAPDDTPGNKNVPIDIYGNKLIGRDGGKHTLGGYSDGGFPPTVGAHMAKALLELNPEFKTLNVPNKLNGQPYASVQAAISDFEQTLEINNRIIKKRKNYIEAFIKEFDLEGKKTWGAKFAQAAADLRRGAEMPLFGPDPDEDSLGHRLYSPQQRAWKVLRGKDISIAGQSIGKPPDKWDSGRNRKKAGTKGETFVDFYSAREAYRLLEMPDTSSADIRLKYETYKDDDEDERSSYEFSLEYDYNLFDEDGVLTPDNKYRLKVVETHRSPSGGGELSRRELKKMGGEIPPPSILDEEEWVYTSHDVITSAATEVDVQEFIDDLDLSEDIQDSYQIESIYRYIAKIFLDNAEDGPAVMELIDQGALRKYFEKRDDSSPGNYDRVNDGFLRRAANLIATGKVDLNTEEDKGGKSKDDKFLEPPHVEDQKKKEEKTKEAIGLEYVAPAFLFGYDPYREPKIIYLDNETYGGVLGRLFPDSVPPPFYVQERRYTGWMDIAAALVPEVDGCEPARRHLLDLKPLASQSAQLGGDLLNDHRLEYDPLCVQEAPFDRVMSNYDAGNIDGALRAIIRVYVLDMYLRAVPVFTQFGITEENYDDLFAVFAADRIKQGLYEDGKPRNGSTDDEYYFRVLEQCVNTIIRKSDAGLLKVDEVSDDWSQEEYDALKRIIKKVDNFYKKNEGELAALSSAAITGQSLFKRAVGSGRQSDLTALGHGSTQFNKAQAKAAKKMAFNEALLEYEQDALVFLKRYVKEEFNAIRQDLSQRLPASVNNIHHLFLLNDTWIRGGAFGSGPFDVQSDPKDASTYNIVDTIPEGLQKHLERLRSYGLGGVADAMGATLADTLESWPFVLEKYIRIEDKDTPPADIRERNSNLYNVVNINDWDGYVKSKKKQGLKGDISDFWGIPELIGETTKIDEHIHTYEIDRLGNGRTNIHVNEAGDEHYHMIENFTLARVEMISGDEDTEHRHKIPMDGWKFGLRICYAPFHKDRDIGAFRDLAATVSDSKKEEDKAFEVSSPSGQRYLIPIASAELPIPDQEFTLFNPDSYDVYCLIEELVKTLEYRFMFKYIYPISRYPSLLAIYSVMGFFASVGASGFPAAGGDMWEKPGGRANRKFRKWVRGPQAFKKSRQAARDVFTTIYEASQAIDFTHESKFGHPDRATSIRDAIRPRVNFEDGLRWWQRGRRVLSRPYNMLGDDCADE